jgi:hypothetical protein
VTNALVSSRRGLCQAQFDMSASQYVIALDGIQKELTGYLQPLGFRKNGRTYNRRVGDGLIQTVNLQMGQKGLPGRFTVNLGVGLPALRPIELGREFPGFIQEYDCEIRARLFRLVFHEDTWLDLDHLLQETAADTIRYMDTAGLPFLEEFESYEAVLAIIDSRGCLPSSNKGRSALIGAIVCVHLKQSDRARAYFERAAAFAGRNRGFGDHIAQVRRTCGF